MRTSSSDHLSRSSTPVSCSRGTPWHAALSRKRYSSPHQSEATLPVRSRFSRFLIRILPRRPLTATSCCTGGGGDRRGALALSPIAIPTATLPATAVGISTAALPSPPSLTPLARPSASSPPSPSHDRSHESTSASCARCSCTDLLVQDRAVVHGVRGDLLDGRPLAVGSGQGRLLKQRSGKAYVSSVTQHTGVSRPARAE